MSFDVMAMNNYGFGGYANPAYTGNPLLTPYNVSQYDENSPWWIRSMYMDPAERARYNANVNNVRNEVMLDNEYNLKKLRREKEYEDQEAARLDDIKRNRQTNLARMAANNLQTVLLSGKMELIKGAWDKYLALENMYKANKTQTTKSVNFINDNALLYVTMCGLTTIASLSFVVIVKRKKLAR